MLREIAILKMWLVIKRVRERRRRRKKELREATLV